MDQSFLDSIPGHWSDITANDSSRVHIGHKFRTTNIYHAAPALETTEEEKKRAAILRDLDYAEAQYRENQIYEVARSTYRWAFEAWSVPLQGWLSRGHDIFWVSGKPGSGKSTFMKFLSRHSKTESLLRNWTRREILIVAAHFFWYAGTSSSLEQSREGLYRNLLHQILRLLPDDAISLLLPKRWNSSNHTPYRSSDWTVKELLDGLHNLSNVAHASFVLFIDALDECSPVSEHSVLLNELQALSAYSNVKICISSRPWKPFETRFKGSKSHLVMQELTRPDMERYIYKELRNAARDAGLDTDLLGGLDSPSWQRREYPLTKRTIHGSGETDTPTHPTISVSSWSSDDEFDSNSSRYLGATLNENLGSQRYAENPLGRLIRQVARRSEGVFLWVYLILKDLREELFAGKEIEELQEFVNEVPAGLMDYYKRGIWKRIGWRRERQVAMAFKIAAMLATAAGKISKKNSDSAFDYNFMSFLHFWHLQHPSQLEDPHFAVIAPIEFLSDYNYLRMVAKTRAFMGEVCRDMIRVEDDGPPLRHASPSIVRPFKRIEFLHQSVLEFLTDPETQTWIDERVPPHFCKPGLLFDLTLLRLKLVPAFRPIRSLLVNLSRILAFIAADLSPRTSRSQEISVFLPKFRAGVSGVGTDLASQYEDLAIQYLRMQATFADLEEDLIVDRFNALNGLSLSFASFGLSEFIRELAMRHPSSLFSIFEHDVFGITIHNLFKDHEDTVAYDLIKALLDIGIVCGTQSWHTFLKLWYNTTVIGIGERMWSVAKMLIMSGIDLVQDICLTHPPPSALRASECNVGCVRRKTADILLNLVPHDHLPELAILLNNYNDTLWLQSLICDRRRKRSALYIGGRATILKAAQGSSSFSFPNFEISYADWVHMHEVATLRDLAATPDIAEPDVLDSSGSSDSGDSSDYRDPYFTSGHKFFRPYDFFRPTGIPFICMECGVNISDDGCLRWICLCCLERDYCTLCLPAAEKNHMGEFICVDFHYEFLLDAKDRVERAIEQIGPRFDLAIKNHELTKTMSHDEAKAHFCSILEERWKMERERKWEYLNDPFKKCLLT